MVGASQHCVPNHTVWVKSATVCLQKAALMFMIEQKKRRNVDKNWRFGVSIPVPHRCERCALPIELNPLSRISFKNYRITFTIKNILHSLSILIKFSINSGVAQRKRGGLITRRSVDQNHSPLISFCVLFLCLFDNGIDIKKHKHETRNTTPPCTTQTQHKTKV